MTEPYGFNDSGKQLLIDLQHFTGSETFTRHALRRNLIMTDGACFLAEKAGAHWLLDIIASYQHTTKEPFQVWNLYVAAPNTSLTYPTGGQMPTTTYKTKAVVIMTDGNSDKPIITQFISFTDFPLSQVTLWLENDTLMLPGER